MSILNKKKQIFGKIAADRTLTEDMPQLKTSNSFPSINNKKDIVTFLTDLIKALEGYEALVESVIETISYYSEIIELEIKNALKLELKSIVSCGVNPSLPDFIKSTGAGIKIQVNKIDFTNLMRIDPTSDTGKFVYTDIPANLIDSTDFNVFLYQVIQNNGSTENWGHQTMGRDILTFRFKDVDINGIDPNNTLTIKAYQNYDNKTLSDLNNDFIDSINLFDISKILNGLVDSIFGTVSNLAKKGISELESQSKTNFIIDKIANSDGKDILSDKFFTFSNEEKKLFENQAKLWKDGKSTVKTSYEYAASLSATALKKSNDSLTGATTNEQKKEAVKKSINDFSDQVASQSNLLTTVIGQRKSSLLSTQNNINSAITSFGNNLTDHKAIKLNFIQQLINNFIKTITNSILTPKVIAIFLINFKIIYGPNETFSDPIDFIKKNKNLIRNITKRVTGIIIQILLKKALKQISKLIAKSALKKQIDKNQANVAQLLSLIGISPEILRQIKGLT